MTVGDLKELLKSNLLEDRHEIVLSFYDRDDEDYKLVVGSEIEMLGGVRKLVFIIDDQESDREKPFQPLLPDNKPREVTHGQHS